MLFRILKVQGDGDLHFVEAVQAYEDTEVRVRELGEVWPGEYAIDNENGGTVLRQHMGREEGLITPRQEDFALRASLDKKARNLQDPALQVFRDTRAVKRP